VVSRRSGAISRLGNQLSACMHPAKVSYGIAGLAVAIFHLCDKAN